MDIHLVYFYHKKSKYTSPKNPNNNQVNNKRCSRLKGKYIFLQLRCSDAQIVRNFQSLKNICYTKKFIEQICSVFIQNKKLNFAIEIVEIILIYCFCVNEIVNFHFCVFYVFYTCWFFELTSMYCIFIKEVAKQYQAMQ